MSTVSDQSFLGNSEKTQLNKETVEKFARNMAAEIVRSLQMETVDLEDFKESQARALASHLIETALTEASKGQNPTSDQQEPRKVDANPRNQTKPALSQSALPILGSLDYPDAPPSTPILPELEKSRQSFSRKLKGGLAKEFSPSPPPPTPKEDHEEDERFEDKVELIEHLMHSLSTEQSGKDQNGRIAEFAEAISRDVMKCVCEEVQIRCNVELLAEKMAKTIVICSLEEARNV